MGLYKMPLMPRTKMSSTTTGTGNLTLSSVSNFLTIANSVIDGERFPYIAILDGETEWEYGEGYTTTSGTVLVRQTIIRNHSNGTSAVNFSAGTKSVFIATGPLTAFYNAGNNIAWRASIGICGQQGGYWSTSANSTCSTNNFHVVPFKLDQFLDCTGVQFYVETADANTPTPNFYDWGLYQITKSDTLRRLRTTGHMTCTTAATHKRNAWSAGNILLQPGWYFLALGSNAANLVVKANSSLHVTATPLGNGLTLRPASFASLTLTPGWTELPEDVDMTTLTLNASSNFIVAGVY